MPPRRNASAGLVQMAARPVPQDDASYEGEPAFAEGGDASGHEPPQLTLDRLQVSHGRPLNAYTGRRGSRCTPGTSSGLRS